MSLIQRCSYYRGIECHCCLVNPIVPLSNLSGTWSSPSVSGARPPPGAYFSLTKIEPDVILLAGGHQGAKLSKDVYVLNLATMVSCEWWEQREESDGGGNRRK